MLQNSGEIITVLADLLQYYRIILDPKKQKQVQIVSIYIFLADIGNIF